MAVLFLSCNFFFLVFIYFIIYFLGTNKDMLLLLLLNVDTIFGRQELTGEQGEGNGPTDRSVVSEEEM